MKASLRRLAATITTDLACGRDQHWVAESYLKSWRDPSRRQGAYLWVSPKDRSAPPKMRSPKTTFVSPEMNTMKKDDLRNLSLEDLYGAVETSFGNLKARMISGSPLDNNNHEAVVNFVAAQLIRTPKFRSKWRFTPGGDHKAQLATIDDPVMRSDVEESLSNISVNQHQILSFLALPKAIEAIGKMRMVLLRSDDFQYFVTSDAPCCVMDYKEKAASVFEALASPTSNILMPLSPKVLAIFDHSDESHGMIGLLPNQPVVHEANAIIWRGADKEIVLSHSTASEEWFSEKIERKLAGYIVL